MREFFISILLLLSCSVYAAAQSFDAGIMGGVAASQVDGDGYGGFNKAGAIAGIWVNRDLNTRWSSRLELRFIQKGSHERDKELSTTIYRLRLNYFELPLTFGYSFREKFNLRAGLSAGYLGSAKEADSSGPIPDSEIVELRKFEISGILGLDYQVTEHLEFDVRITYSAIPICPNQPSIEHWRNFGPFNRVLEFCIFYQF